MYGYDYYSTPYYSNGGSHFESTLDESPMAYKNIEDIINNIESTVDIIKTIKPVYNFKAFE